MEFRWIIALTLWTLLIGPVLDFAPHGPAANPPKTKNVVPAKAKLSR